MKNILILHGWGSSAEKWKNVRMALEGRGYTVYAPDLPGFGKTPPPPQAWEISDYMEWVREFCEKNNLSQVFLLGHSFGGSIAIKFAAKYPEKLQALVLCCSAGIRNTRQVRKSLIKKIAKTGKNIFNLPILKNLLPAVRKIFYGKILRKTDYLKAQGAMKATFKKVISEDLTNYLPKIQVPTIIIWGKKDKITPLKDGFLMKEKIPNAKLEILEKIKHTPHLENPELLAKEVSKFIQ